MVFNLFISKPNNRELEQMSVLGKS